MAVGGGTGTDDVGEAGMKTCLVEEAAFEQTDQTAEAKKEKPVQTLFDEEATGVNGIAGIVVIALRVDKPEILTAIVVRKGKVYDLVLNDEGTMSAVVVTIGMEGGTTSGASGCLSPTH
jgi:hypothetical protein